MVISLLPWSLYQLYLSLCWSGQSPFWATIVCMINRALVSWKENNACHMFVIMIKLIKQILFETCHYFFRRVRRMGVATGVSSQWGLGGEVAIFHDPLRPICIRSWRSTTIIYLWVHLPCQWKINICYKISLNSVPHCSYIFFNLLEFLKIISWLFTHHWFQCLKLKQGTLTFILLWYN